MSRGDGEHKQCSPVEEEETDQPWCILLQLHVHIGLEQHGHYMEGVEHEARAGERQELLGHPCLVLSGHVVGC